MERKEKTTSIEEYAKSKGITIEEAKSDLEYFALHMDDLGIQEKAFQDLCTYGRVVIKH